jgi:ABC-type lipoprotein export system ATPase subunit
MIGNSRLIHLDGVSRRYELGGTTVTALDGVDLAVSDGEFVVVLGPSGSGKTTLINLIGSARYGDRRHDLDRRGRYQ